MRSVVVLNQNRRANTWLGPRRLLIVAAIFHLAVTGAVYALGRYAVLPRTFDTNGIAVSFASDGIGDRADAAGLSDLLRRGHLREWVTAPLEFHLKLYSICFALFGPWLGITIISIEPLNVLCYLAILILVFQLGREAFNSHAAIIASAIVGLWPSLLLHTTQMLKDPMFIVGMLAFILITLRLLSRTLSWPGALLAAFAGGFIALFVWLARDSMGQLLMVIAIVGAVMLVARQLHEKHIHTANVAGMALLLLISTSVTRFVPGFNKPDGPSTATKARTKISETLQPNSNPGFATHVNTLRRRFVLMYPDSTSNIDSDVQLTSIAEIVRYLPRAAVIGFFAPFPNMWFASGRQVGSSGRLLSGIETLAMYAIEGLAIVGLWRERRRFSAWLLVSTAAIGLIALGLIVINVGTLYRLRYVFLILIIIVAAKGFTDLSDWYENRRRR
ncbi:MAG: hypothetical protein ND895_10135 [Pyrinomonadaceae bacterium]|nr:hypothetical protein [Pyrinomonadaceae bacterium]